MNENIDLTKILKGCPKGIKFYSTIYGEVEFSTIENGPYPVTFITKHFSLISFAPNGRYLENYDGECTIFPSKYQRDWSKFERFWDKPKIEKFDPKTLQPFDKVLVRDNLEENWIVNLFGFIDKDNNCICSAFYWDTCIPYNEETKHLLGTSDDCPEYYKWWEK